MSGERAVQFDRFDGGVNYWQEEDKLGTNESPEMVNLQWQNGALCCRDGQTYLTAQVENGVGYAVTSEPFWDRLFLHISSSLYRVDPDGLRDAEGFLPLREIAVGVPCDRGTFFRYGEHLYYKNRGGFYQIAYTPEGEQLFTVQRVEELAYVPTILLNADPRTGSGDLYQPENRLTGRKRVKYTAAFHEETMVDTGNGVKRIFTLGYSAADGLQGVSAVYAGTMLLSPALYEVNTEVGTVTFTTAPEDGVELTFVPQIAIGVFKLPVGDVDAVEEVRVNGTLYSEEDDYTVDLVRGSVTFVTAPGAKEQTNSVEILFRKDNAEALQSVMSCRYGGVYGGGVQVCMVLGGCEAQPNAIFWNGNNDAAMDPAYFPMAFYNLCGDGAESVTGFGRQYTDLIIFKERSIGKAGFSVEEVEGRDSISLTYERVNDKIGCDLPWSIQLIENNLTFANADGGVFSLRSASAAYENNVALVSRKVNGSDARPGLLYDLRVTGGTEGFAVDDGGRYILSVNGHAYVWDYRISTAGDPTWFYFTNIDAVGWWQRQGKVGHLNAAGRLSVMGDVLCDYDAPIVKKYRFPTLLPDCRRRDILRLFFTLRGDRESCTRLFYKTENGEREDPAPIRVTATGLVPRDLSQRDLRVSTAYTWAVRRPLCRSVEQFSLTLYNDAAGQDLTLLSAQMYVRNAGRCR